MTRNVTVFAVAALLEIAGCFAFWAWLRRRVTPLVLVLGDLSFYHDMNGLFAARRHGLAAVIVLLNNDGGGIFSLLPQADDPEHFEELFGTPHGLDFRTAAALYGLGSA